MNRIIKCSSAILISVTLSIFAMSVSLAEEKAVPSTKAPVVSVPMQPKAAVATRTIPAAVPAEEESAAQAPIVKPDNAKGEAPEPKEEVKAVQGETKEMPGEVKETQEETAPLEPGNVTVNFKGADIRTVLSYISEVSGVDIVASPDVKGIVDLRLTNKPWKTALDVIVRNYGFAYDREGDIIRVVTVDKLKQEELTTQAISLNYGKSKDVVGSIKNIMSERGKVMYDDRTNTVLITDVPTNIYKIGQIIEKLDRKTDQVLIEARVIETVLNNTEKLGVDWNAKFSISGAKRPTTLPFNQFQSASDNKGGDLSNYFPQVLTASPQQSTTGAGGVTSTTVASDFPGLAAGIAAFPFATKDQFTFGTLDFTQFSAVLEMIEQRADTNIVSDPRIATLNNSEALINVGQTLNLPKYERNSSTGKMEITGYDPKDLGIILKVTPHINKKDEIVVDLEPQISDLLRYDTLDAASGIVAPVFTTRQARTQVMIKDGDTIFIGGLIKENDVQSKTKLPFFGDLLGDVPYLGLLFTKKETTKQKTELIFFITVNLMTADKEIKDMPNSNKVYVPLYTLSKDMNQNDKRRHNK